MRTVCTDRNFDLGLRSIALRLLAELLHSILEILDSGKHLGDAFCRRVFRTLPEHRCQLLEHPVPGLGIRFLLQFILVCLHVSLERILTIGLVVCCDQGRLVFLAQFLAVELRLQAELCHYGRESFEKSFHCYRLKFN